MLGVTVAMGLLMKQHPGQLDGDVTTADYCDLLRPLGKGKKTVGGNAKLGARQVRRDGLAARSHDNFGCGVLLAVDEEGASVASRDFENTVTNADN